MHVSFLFSECVRFCVCMCCDWVFGCLGVCVPRFFFLYVVVLLCFCVVCVCV